MSFRVTRGQPHEYEEIETGQRFWSCSQVLKVLDPDVYEMVDDAVLEAASARGVNLHKIWFYWLASLKGLCAVPPRPNEFGGYYDALGKFIADYRPEPILLEESSCDRKRGVAGTPDGKLFIARLAKGVVAKLKAMGF